ERLGLDAPLGTIDRANLNVKGSSLAAGHPFAATGGRIIATAAKLLNQKGSGRDLVSICAEGSKGVTAHTEKKLSTHLIKNPLKRAVFLLQMSQLKNDNLPLDR